jgi:KDO2-lipid IV(A) lauroyltransferase
LFHAVRALPLAVAAGLGAALGRLVYWLDAAHRRVGLTNLAIALPEKSPRERKAILKESFANLGRMGAEFCHMRSLTRATIERYVTFEDPQLWRRLVAEHGERGALILTGHFGNWEWLACAHALYGYPVHMVHRPLRNRLVDAFVRRERERFGTRVLRKSAAGFEVVRTLRRAGIVVLPLDQNASGRMATFVDFFGRPASTSVGLAALALRSGTVVIPAFLVREGGSSRHRIVIRPAVAPVRTGNEESDLRETTRRFTRVLEEVIRAHPEQWLWQHKRWKRRPQGEPAIY